MTILMGLNDSFYLGPGWHACATDERYGLPFRPTAHRAELHIPGELAGGEMAILAASSPPMLGRAVQAQAHLKGRIIGETVFTNDLWRIWRLPWPNAAMSAGFNSPLVLELSVAEPFVPDAHLKNGDHRVMGIFVSAIRWIKGS